MKRLLKAVIPEPGRLWLRRQWNRTANFGLKRSCPVCGSVLAAFAAYGNPVELEAVCPVCRSKAPHRLAYLYFRDHPELFQQGRTMLHVAPEAELGPRLAERCRRVGMTYRVGGLGYCDERRLDLRNTGLPDNSFHLIYSCHVLVMIVEDRQAMREVARILHPQGVAILQEPAFSSVPGSFEPATVAERLAAYNDPNVVRVYNEDDYTHRLREAGFDVAVFRSRAYSAEQIERHQLKSEILHVCRKPQ